VSILRYNSSMYSVHSIVLHCDAVQCSDTLEYIPTYSTAVQYSTRTHCLLCHSTLVYVRLFCACSVLYCDTLPLFR